jgi:hypothetical protein
LGPAEGAEDAGVTAQNRGSAIEVLRVVRARFGVIPVAAQQRAIRETAAK